MWYAAPAPSTFHLAEVTVTGAIMCATVTAFGGRLLNRASTAQWILVIAKVFSGMSPAATASEAEIEALLCATPSSP